MWVKKKQPKNVVIKKSLSLSPTSSSATGGARVKIRLKSPATVQEAVVVFVSSQPCDGLAQQWNTARCVRVSVCMCV